MSFRTRVSYQNLKEVVTLDARTPRRTTPCSSDFFTPPLDAYRGYTIQETELYLPWKMQYFQDIIKNKILHQS